MEIAPFSQGGGASRTLSDISIASNSSSKAQDHPSFGAQTHFRDSRVKLMCSHGGKILPRPSDRKLRYVGGETRMVSVPRHISYAALLRKLTDIYGPDLAVKYQLPEEDLDALVSVSSDEDLENMMDECDRLEAAEGSSRLRVFVFSSFDPEALDLNDLADPKISEQRYVDAVNAVQVEAGLKKKDDSGSGAGFRNLDGLDGHGWDASQMPGRVFGPPENLQLQVVPQENILPSGNMPTSNFPTTNYLSGSVTPPHTLVSTTQQTSPSDFASSQAVVTKGYYGAGGGAEDFRDLESGESATSSVSSQHDFYNRYSTSYGHGEDQLAKAEQPYVDVARRKRGALQNRVSTPSMSVMPPTRGTAFEQIYDILSAGEPRGIDGKLQGDLPLSPGAMLQKQLQADQDSIEHGSMQMPQHLVEQQQMGRQPLTSLDPWTPMAQDGILAGVHPIHNLLQTQQFEPSEIHQLSGGISGLVSPTSSVRSAAEKADPVSQEVKQHEVVSMDLPTGFSGLDYANTLYNQDGRQTNEVPTFASQPFSHQPYNPVFQTGSLDISPSGNDEVDEFLVLSPTTATTNQLPMHDYDYGITSQAPWLSPDLDSLRLSSQAHVSKEEKQGLHTTQDALENNSGISSMQAIGMPRTQNYDGIQGALPFLRLYSPVVPDAVVAHDPEVFNTVVSEGGSVEVQDMSSRENLSTSKPVSLRSSGDLNWGHDAPGLGELNQGYDATIVADLSLAEVGLSELSIDKNWKDPSLGSHQGLETLKETLYSSAVDGETQLNIEETRDDDDERVTSVYVPTPFPAAPSLVEAWSTTTQSEHELESVAVQPFKQEKGLEDPESSLILAKGTTIEDPKLVIDEVDLFQSAADMSLSPAAAAEVEAIAHGLQIIRHCDLEELRELGSGTFGTVYHGKWRGTDVAIKRIKSSCFTGRPSERERLIADFWREAYILGQLHHPNVVAFYGVVPDGPGGTLATVTEYMVNGSLKQALQKKDRALDRRKRLLIAMDAAFGMEYLHGKNVVHFDLKCENLLVNLRDLQRPICKVGDLGLSKVKQQTMVSGGVRGTLPWMAPELLNGSSSLVSEKVDVFSFGIVLWELLTGEEPYATMHYGAIIGGIVSNTLRPPVPRWCDAAWRTLMETCWSADPAARPTFSEIARSLRAMEATLSAKGQGQAQLSI